MAAVETWRAGVFAPGGHPLLPLLGRALLALHVTDSACLAAGLAAALTAVAAAPLTALACLESVRAARAESGWHAHSPGTADCLCASILACACVASAVALRQATQGGWTVAGLGVAAAFLAATQRRRRMGRLDAAGAVMLGLAWAIGQTGEPGFLIVPVAGLLPVWFTALSRPRRDGVEAPRGRLVPVLCVVGAAVVGLVPWVVMPVLSHGSQPGSVPAPQPTSPNAAAAYFFAYLVGPGTFNVGVDAGTVAARDGVARLARDLGPCAVVGVLLAAAWVVVFRGPSGENPKGRAVSAGLWPGALLTVACWTLGWSYTGSDRDARLSLCLLGLCMCAAAGYAVASEMLQLRFPRAVAPLLAALALGVAAWTAPRISAQWRESCSGAAYAYAVATLARAPEGCVFELGDELEPVEELAYPLIYGQEVLGLRPDVSVVVAGGTPSPPAPLPRERGARAERGRGEGGRLHIRFTDWRAARDAGWPVHADGHLLALGAASSGEPDTGTAAAVAAGALSGGASAAEEALRSRATQPSAPEAGIVAQAWADEGEWGRALASARTAIALDPLRPQAWRVLGEALLYLEGTEPAEECLRVAVALSRRHPDERAVRLLAQLKSPSGGTESGPAG